MQNKDGKGKLLAQPVNRIVNGARLCRRCRAQCRRRSDCAWASVGSVAMAGSGGLLAIGQRSGGFKDLTVSLCSGEKRSQHAIFLVAPGSGTNQ